MAPGVNYPLPVVVLGTADRINPREHLPGRSREGWYGECDKGCSTPRGPRDPRADHLVGLRAVARRGVR